MVKINGQEMDIAGKTVADYLENSEYDSKRIVVEVNEEIVPKTLYAETRLADGDVVEVISFMGGG